MDIPGILNQDEDTEHRRLLDEVISCKGKLWQDEKRTVNRLGELHRRFTRYEARQILEIHGRVVK